MLDSSSPIGLNILCSWLDGVGPDHAVCLLHYGGCHIMGVIVLEARSRIQIEARSRIQIGARSRIQIEANQIVCQLVFPHQTLSVFA